MPTLEIGQMTYSVHQHWDPLKVCIVGKSYPPEFYNYIKNSKIRTVMQRIAEETEEDYQKLIRLLKKFDVEILRPDVYTYFKNAIKSDGKILSPPMTPRDYSASIGNNFYFGGGFWCPQYLDRIHWDILKGQNWPKYPETWDDYKKLPNWVLEELELDKAFPSFRPIGFDHILDQIHKNSNIILGKGIDSAMVLRVGKDLYFGTKTAEFGPAILNQRDELFPDYRCHTIDSGGHLDGTICAVVPGLIISQTAAIDFDKLFPGWKVICIPNEGFNKIQGFLKLKSKNKGKWWVPGEEFNDDFINYVESHLNHWVGYIEESVFSINMLVINEKNVICSSFNEQVFKAFEEFGITPHIVNFRHRYFWDGGLHCITSDIHREGVQTDYFPERRLT
jgi:hypothetical protein